MVILPKSFHLDWRMVLIWSNKRGFPKNFPISQCWKRRRALPIASPSKQMNSEMDAFSFHNTGPSTSGEEFGGRFLIAMAISAHERGEGEDGPPLSMARGGKR